MLIFSLQGEVRTTYKTACGSALGRWVNAQRTLFNDGKLKKERQEALERVGLRLAKKNKKKTAAASKKKIVPKKKSATKKKPAPKKKK